MKSAEEYKVEAENHRREAEFWKFMLWSYMAFLIGFGATAILAAAIVVYQAFN
jgi:hypothetical protein